MAQYKFCVKTHEFNGVALFIDNRPVVSNGDTKAPGPSSKEKEYRVQLAGGES